MAARSPHFGVFEKLPSVPAAVPVASLAVHAYVPRVAAAFRGPLRP